MVCLFPQLLSLSINSIRKKYNNVKNFGYTDEEVLKMTTCMGGASVYGASITAVSNKLQFYNSIGIHQTIVEYSQRLIPSISRSYARYKFMTNLGEEITDNNCSRLFMGNQAFSKYYGISKEELLKMYNYEKDMEDRNGRVI